MVASQAGEENLHLVVVARTDHAAKAAKIPWNTFYPPQKAAIIKYIQRKSGIIPDFFDEKIQ